MKNIKLAQASILLGALAVAANGYANEGNGIEYSGSGFMTLGVGKMLGGTRANVMDYDCPCYLADYAQAGVYDGRSGLQWRPDTKIGVQGSASLDNLSLTAQIVARGADTGSVGLEWLYGSYKMNDKFTFQIGRKRIPMFYYSDVQDVGIALPWTHLPPGVYGWEAVNYNGINVRYQDKFGDWSTTANLIAGSESRKDTGYYKVFGYGRLSKSDIKWTNIIGGDLTMAKDWFETRLVYIQSDTEQNNVSNYWNGQIYDPAIGPINPPAKQQIYGLTINADYQDWLLRTEFIHINHPGLGWKDFAQLVGVGYRYEKWQPMATWSQYKGTEVSDGLLPTAVLFPANRQQTLSLTLRYDLSTSSALKAQYDRQTDHSSSDYSAIGYDYGDSRLLTFTYDMVF
ncbi:MAG: hypothetical protein OEV26_02825, partial [Gallionella sp.]|nr:hypothetical protein [Gallionella sp.]